MIVRGYLPEEESAVKTAILAICAASSSGISPETMLDEVKESIRQAWVVESGGKIIGVVLTKFAPPCVYIDGLSGVDPESWTNAVGEEIEKWAAYLGAERVVSFMRPGLTRVAKKRGWRVKHIEMVKELRDA